MDKNKIDELLKELNMDINEYYILSGASLVIRGIRETCEDLDLCISEEVFRKLSLRYDIKHIDGKPKNLFQITEEIEAFVEPKENFNCEIVKNYPLENIERIIEYKKQRNYDKDKKDIIGIENYLNNLKYEQSCGAYVINDGKVLIVQHKNGNHWDFPKGHIEAGETKKQTAIREVFEETGIEIKIASDKEYQITYKPKMDVQKDVTFFEAECIGGILKKQEAEISSLKWVEIENVFEYLTFERSKKLFEKFLKDKNLL